MVETINNLKSSFCHTPYVGPLLYKIHGGLTRKYIQLFTVYVNQKHHASIDPYRLFEIPPEDIIHEVESQFWYQPISTVEPGDWDRETEQFDEHFFYRSLEDHFKRGVDWKQTELYERKLQELRAGEINLKRYGECNSAILERLRDIDQLYESIKKDGYKTQRELRNETNLAVETQREHLPPELFEIAVNIGRNGEWLFDDGRHRLTIAKLLDLDTVPVRVLVRHEHWQEFRNQIVRNYGLGKGLPTNMNHPDLRNL